MDCSRSSRSASGQINLRCLASSCTSASKSQRTSCISMRCWPSGEPIHYEGIIREDTVLRLFPALLAHEVLKQVWAVGARFVLARRRVVRDIHHAVKAPEYFVASDSRNAARLVVSGSCAQSWLTNCESMVPIG